MRPSAWQVTKDNDNDNANHNTEQEEEQEPWSQYPMAACPSSPSRARRQVEHACRSMRSAPRCRRLPDCAHAHAITAVAPTYGTVVCADAARGLVTVYLARHDNHQVFAPVGGRVAHLSFCQMQIHRPELEFVSDAHKGRAMVTLQHPSGVCVEFWLEVGHRSYITDRVRLSQGNQPLDVGARVQQGERIGEIILGSLAELHLPVSGSPTAWQLHVARGDRVYGGRSVLATWRCPSF